jgi:hypothetical protein
MDDRLTLECVRANFGGYVKDLLVRPNGKQQLLSLQDNDNATRLARITDLAYLAGIDSDGHIFIGRVTRLTCGFVLLSAFLDVGQ